MVLQENTLVTTFYGRSRAWGRVIRTINASTPGRFTLMTTFGHRIATACNNGTVRIYDSATGALRLSLNPLYPARAIRGSPDGSLLFCAHEGPSITVWDIQTGGLIHTFVLECKAEDIAISLKGGYLACRLLNGSVKIWDVASREEGTAAESGSLVLDLCWVDPEQQLAVAEERSVLLWDAVVREVVWRIPMERPVRFMVYSQTLRMLAIMTTPEDTNPIKNPTELICSRTSTRSTCRSPGSYWKGISCCAPSQVSEEFVCGIEGSGLALYSPLVVQALRKLDHPATVTTVSTLSDGTVVVNTAGSGIQLLDLDADRRSLLLPATPVLTVEAIDEGRIIAIVLTACPGGRTLLLESTTLSTLFDRYWEEWELPTDLPSVLCASLENEMVLFSLEGEVRGRLALWQFSGGYRWIAPIDERPLVGFHPVVPGLSPSTPRTRQLISTCGTHKSDSYRHS